MRREEREAWERRVKELTGAVLVSGHRALASAAGTLPGVGRFGNRATLVHGRRFASKLEADRYRELLLEQAAGSVAWFVRQVPFDVAPGVVYRADFVVVWNRSGTWGSNVSVEDTKGHLTAVARTKIAAVEERYGIRVVVLKRHQVGRFA